MDRKLSSRYDKENPGDNLQLQIGQLSVILDIYTVHRNSDELIRSLSGIPVKWNLGCTILMLFLKVSNRSICWLYNCQQYLLQITFVFNIVD